MLIFLIVMIITDTIVLVLLRQSLIRNNKVLIQIAFWYLTSVSIACIMVSILILGHGVN